MKSCVSRQTFIFLPFLLLSIFLVTISCDKKEVIEDLTYSASGMVVLENGDGLSGIRISYGNEFVTTDDQGNWLINGLTDNTTLTPESQDYNFTPESIDVLEQTENIIFQAELKVLSKEMKIINWFRNQQLENGILESTENNNSVSLYDQALSAMVFLINEDFSRAEKIFDFFNARITSELMNGPGGYSQFRDKNGNPGNHRWMGDNAWFLIALNNFKYLTNNDTYDVMALEISNWLLGLQDTDGGLFAGYGSNNILLNYKVTEGNIDAFNAVKGYTSFHSNLLQFLKVDRWDDSDKNLMSWPDNPPYRYALDNHSWSYCMFPDYPISALTTTDRFKTTQVATINGQPITGFDIDEDKDAVFIEGTGQMALAFHLAGMQNESDFYLAELEKIFMESTSYTKSAGFPYSSNQGTGYGDVPLWNGVDTEIAISGGAWYLFAKKGFNPFAVGREKNIPLEDMFWVN